jgi:hypothetical protein
MTTTDTQPLTEQPRRWRCGWCGTEGVAPSQYAAQMASIKHVEDARHIELGHPTLPVDYVR